MRRKYMMALGGAACALRALGETESRGLVLRLLSISSRSRVAKMIREHARYIHIQFQTVKDAVP